MLTARLDADGTGLANGSLAITDLQEDAGAGGEVGVPGQGVALLPAKVDEGGSDRLVTGKDTIEWRHFNAYTRIRTARAYLWRRKRMTPTAISSGPPTTSSCTYQEVGALSTSPGELDGLASDNTGTLGASVM